MLQDVVSGVSGALRKLVRSTGESLHPLEAGGGQFPRGLRPSFSPLLPGGAQSREPWQAGAARVRAGINRPGGPAPAAGALRPRRRHCHRRTIAANGMAAKRLTAASLVPCVLAGKAGWIAGTTFLILIVPLIIEMDREQQVRLAAGAAGRGLLREPMAGLRRLRGR